MDETIILTGGKRSNRPFSMKALSDCYEAAIYEIDFHKKTISRSYIETDTNPEIYTNSYSLSFRSGSLRGETLYTCTHSEIIEFDIGSFSVRDRLSSPLFNDLHYVGMVEDRMLVAITGLDHIGEVISRDEIDLYPVLADSQSQPISRDKDYRVISTKPHRSHPNHVFKLGDHFWATRFCQGDAVRLDDITKKFNITTGRPHDGLVRDGRLYFTTANGTIVVFDEHTLRRLEEHDVSSLYRDYNPGWCRGIEILENYAYIGFSALRWTFSLENINFIARNLLSFGRELRKNLPSRIVKYDMCRREIVDEMLFQGSEVGLIFSILKTAK